MAFFSNIKIKKIIGIRTLKTGIGAAVAMLIAQFIGLMYWPSAGIITILSIQGTKRTSIQIAVKRVIATVVALVLATLLFMIGGHSPVIFGLFLLIFIPITVRFELVDGIVMAAVLVTHLMGEERIGTGILLNEVGLVVVGVSVALILNLYMPSVEAELAISRSHIEQSMYSLFLEMSECLRARASSVQEDTLFISLRDQISKAKVQAYKYANNHVFAKVSPYEKYFEMRDSQYQVMQYMREHYSRLFMTYSETEQVADFTLKVAKTITGQVTAVQLLQELEGLREHFRLSPLPQTREEFENRAMLYQFLNDLEHFLEIKRVFKDELTEREVEQYNKGYRR
ncbi:MAG: aromatic acid exporter family protein [Cellulosilyticaceae bacterium]